MKVSFSNGSLVLSLLNNIVIDFNEEIIMSDENYKRNNEQYKNKKEEVDSSTKS